MDTWTSGFKMCYQEDDGKPHLQDMIQMVLPMRESARTRPSICFGPPRYGGVNIKNSGSFFFKNPVPFSKLRTFLKTPDFFKNSGLFQKLRTFSKTPDFFKNSVLFIIPCFFKNSVLFKHSPFFQNSL